MTWRFNTVEQPCIDLARFDEYRLDFVMEAFLSYFETQ